MSLYGEYILEREGKEILEDHRGFATYSFTAQGCYIEDVYVRPEFRRDGTALYYVEQIQAIAKEKGISQILTTVCPSAKGSTESLKAVLGCGFNLQSSQLNFIWFVKFI